MKRNRKILLSILTAAAILTVADLLCGSAGADMTVMKMLRIPRILTAILAGGALAMSGAQMQSILRNSLADPHIMGISSGAALGAAIATMSGGSAALTTGGVSIALAAMAGAVLTASAILAVSKKFRSSGSLLIFGVMTGFIINAVVSVLQFTSDAESLKIFYSWSAGSFSTTTWKGIAVIAAATTIGAIIAFNGRKGLDIMLFGDEFAEMAGAAPKRIRIQAILSCCIMTGAVTAYCGPLGFVGIVAPHIARAIWKTSSHSTILPASFLCGSMTGLTADLISQASPTPLPAAGTMALVGIPVIIYILIKNQSSNGTTI